MIAVFATSMTFTGEAAKCTGPYVSLQILRVIMFRYVARMTSGGHSDALECSSGCIAGVRLLLNCITAKDTKAAADSEDGKSLNGRERLYGMGIVQLLTIMCSSAQNSVSVLALDALCQLVTLPVISLHPAPFDTRSTRMYVAQLEASLKLVWGAAAIKTVRDAVITADSRTAARSAALSLHIIYRETWGSHWCFLGMWFLFLQFFLFASPAGTRPLACWDSTPRPSASQPCLKLASTRGTTS